MPFEFPAQARSRTTPPPRTAPPLPPAPQGPRRRTGVAFDGLTEEWRLVGRMNIDGRLSDALNKREAIAIHDVQWAPIDGSAPLAPAPGPEERRPVRPDPGHSPARTRCRS